MSTELRITELDNLFARVAVGSQRRDDRPLILRLVERESTRLRRLVAVNTASKAKRLKRQLERRGAIAE